MPDEGWMKTLFGRAARARVGLWVVEQDAAFSQHEAVASVQADRTAVVQELDKLEDLGLITTVEVEGSRRKYYVVVDHPLWQIFRAANAARDEMQQAGRGASVATRGRR